MNTKTFDMYESSVRSYCRHFPVVFNRAKGACTTRKETVTWISSAAPVH